MLSLGRENKLSLLSLTRICEKMIIENFIFLAYFLAKPGAVRGSSPPSGVTSTAPLSVM